MQGAVFGGMDGTAQSKAFGSVALLQRLQAHTKGTAFRLGTGHQFFEQRIGEHAFQPFLLRGMAHTAFLLLVALQRGKDVARVQGTQRCLRFGIEHAP